MPFPSVSGAKLFPLEQKETPQPEPKEFDEVPQVEREVEFKKTETGEKFVSASVAGQTFTFTPEEYNAAIYAKGEGMVTPQVEEFRRLREQELATRGEAIQQREGDIRAGEDVTGLAAETRAELLREPLSLEPETKPKITPQAEFIGRVLTGKSSSQEIFKEAGNFIKGLGVAGVIAAGAAAGAFAIPAIAKAAAGIAIGGKVTGSVAGLAGIAAAGFGVAKLTDVKGGEITNLKRELEKMSGTSSTILSAVQNGLDPHIALQELNKMTLEVTRAERRIKELGINNVRFRADKDYLELQQVITDARFNILERVNGVENVARTGTPQVRPEELAYIIAQLEGGVE